MAKVLANTLNGANIIIVCFWTPAQRPSCARADSRPHTGKSSDKHCPLLTRPQSDRGACESARMALQNDSQTYWLSYRHTWPITKALREPSPGC